MLKLVQKVYPKAMWPTSQQIVGLGMWGGVAAATGLYLVQPFDYVKKLVAAGGDKKE